jgi:hypothetical protein
MMRPQDNEIIQKIIHFNYPQQAGWIVNANTTVFVAGRAFGKDFGVVAPVGLRNMKGMPRGATAFITPTFIKAKTDMIPALVNSWEKLGFYEEIDFWVAKYIPSNIKHEKAYEHPREPQYSIFWKNGHVIRIIGLDSKKTANGQSNDYLILNEGRFVKYEDFIGRVKPTNRGNEDTKFADLHYHHGTLITTDMPASRLSKWILDYEKKMDQDQIDLIVTFDLAYREALKNIGDELLSIDPERSVIIKKDKDKLLETMRDLVASGKLTEALDKRFRKELQRLDDILFELRREAVHFIRASTLDNVDAVGVRYINEMKRDLSDAEFNRSILNLEIDEVSEPFYSNFNDELHGYDDINYAYLEAFDNLDELPQAWRKDDDLDKSRPLQGACDWNKRMTCMVIGQEFPHVFKIQNALQVFDPERIRHLAKQFDDYYAGYPTKKFIHHYDHTAIGEDSLKEKSYAQELHDELTNLGWTVEDNYIGKASGHGLRNKLFLRVYAEDDINTKPLRINSTNCKDNLMKSLSNCGSKQNVKGIIQKEKAPELSLSVDPREAPHFSDAHDTLYIGVFNDRLGDMVFEPDATM